MVFVFTACGNSDGGDSSAAEWTRKGTFTDDNGATLMISPSEYDDLDGWYVGLFTEDRMNYWYIPQVGDTEYIAVFEEE